MQCRRKTFMVHQTFVWWALYLLYKFVKIPIRHLGLAIGNVRRFSPTLSLWWYINQEQNFSEISINIEIIPIKKINLGMLSAKWRPSCRSCNVIPLLPHPHKMQTWESKWQTWKKIFNHNFKHRKKIIILGKNGNSSLVYGKQVECFSHKLFELFVLYYYYFSYWLYTKVFQLIKFHGDRLEISYMQHHGTNNKHYLLTLQQSVKYLMLRNFIHLNHQSLHFTLTDNLCSVGCENFEWIL